MDENRIFGKRLPNDLKVILSALDPFKQSLAGVVVESTFNWYWLVDALQDNGYRVHLANPSAFSQYAGLKHTDDKSDAYWLAHMYRLGILPEGYIYPAEHRPVRDMLRRRTMFVRQRTSHILSLQSTISRYLGYRMPSNEIKQLEPADAQDIFACTDVAFIAAKNIGMINFLKASIKDIEKQVLSKCKLQKQFSMLQTMPGIGKILALTIMLEVGDILRFAKAGNYVSYCRCVDSKRISNGKKKGVNNKKNGNKYLAWAYVEAANFAIRCCLEAKRFYQKKMAKTNKVVAIKALSSKLCRASYHVMRDQVPYDVTRVFC